MKWTKLLSTLKPSCLAFQVNWTVLSVNKALFDIRRESQERRRLEDRQKAEGESWGPGINKRAAR